MTTSSMHLSPAEWAEILTSKPQPLAPISEEPDPTACHYCGSANLEEQTRYEMALCPRCYDECLASDEADDAYDAWRDERMGA